MKNDIKSKIIDLLKKNGFDYFDSDILNGQDIFRNGDTDVVFEVIENKDNL